MIPSAKQIEEWSSSSDPGYIQIPESAFHDLLWVLRMAEKSEAEGDAWQKAIENLAWAHARRATTAGPWTLRERDALEAVMDLVEKRRKKAAA